MVVDKAKGIHCSSSWRFLVIGGGGDPDSGDIILSEQRQLKRESDPVSVEQCWQSAEAGDKCRNIKINRHWIRIQARAPHTQDIQSGFRRWSKKDWKEPARIVYHNSNGILGVIIVIGIGPRKWKPPPPSLLQRRTPNQWQLISLIVTISSNTQDQAQRNPGGRFHHRGTACQINYSSLRARIRRTIDNRVSGSIEFHQQRNTLLLPGLI